MNAGRPRPRRRLEREVHQCLPEDDGLRSAHGRGGPGSRPRRRPSRRCSKRRPLVVELGEVAGEGRILERPDPSSLASRRRAVGVGRSSVAADTRAAAGGGRRVCHGAPATTAQDHSSLAFLDCPVQHLQRVLLTGSEGEQPAGRFPAVHRRRGYAEQAGELRDRESALVA